MTLSTLPAQRTAARRAGVALTVLVALIALTARLAAGQTPAGGGPPQVISLGEAARLAARQSASVDAARLRTTEAEARVRQSRAALLPNVSALASDGSRTFNTATLGLEVPGFFDPRGEVLGPVRVIDFRGRVQSSLVDLGAIQRVRGAQASARAADADAANVAEQAAAGAAAAYLRALRAQAQVDARTADSVLAGELLGIAQDQLRAGTGVALDVTRAQAQVAATRAQLIVARNERDRARLDLLRTLNLSLDAPVVLSDSLGGLAGVEDSLITAAAESLAIERALRSRPDLRALEEQINAAQRQLRATRAERYPTLGVFVDDGMVGKSYGRLLNTYTYGFQLSVPIFTGFRAEGREQEQEALQRELDVRRRDLRQQASVEVRGALLDLASAREQVAAARERLGLAEQELSQARERFAAGVAGNADIITASLNLNASRNFVIDALTLYQSARVALARAEGAVTELP